MNDQNGTDTGNHETSPRAGMPPVAPPQPSRPPTSSLPILPPAVTVTDNTDVTDVTDDKPAPKAGEPRQTLFKVGFVVAGLVLLGLLTWWLATLIASGNEQAANQPPAPAVSESTSPSAQPTRGELPQDGVSALDYQLGDCFENFDPEATESRVVACTTGHSAQLVAVYRFPESDSYPGIAALREKGREICQDAGLTDAVANYVLMQRNAYPSDTSWEQGDRRVDCYVTADKGNIIMESLIP
ncbi:septum formation family protein [Arthrobacter sp. LjRoot78]|uniref:septum formation family protein n=1 Tax=Arthrobacter sp. LjRoot78 TaxID=3342338 RepID=UPI003ED0AE6C